MSRQTFRYRVQITLRAPILSQTSGALGFGVDSAMLRDPDGRPALPGTLVKGNLRQSWDLLSTLTGGPAAGLIADWLGIASDNGGDNAPHRAALTFYPWWCDETWKPGQPGRRYRIQVDVDTGAVADGMLQVIESPYPAGQPVTFTGTVLARIPVEQCDQLRDWLHRGLGLVPALGGLKGNGFGRVERVVVKRVNANPPLAKPPTTVKGCRRVGLRIRPETPFCFARPAAGQRNLIVSEDFIPGGALIAAIALPLDEDRSGDPHRKGARWPTLHANRDRLYVTHARPVVRLDPDTVAGKKQRRPIQAPLGIAKIGGRFVDLSGVAGRAPLSGPAPEFAIDWKRQDHEALAPALAGAALPAGLRRHLRLRNEIDRVQGTARDGVLFSQDTVLPNDCDWLANLDLSDTTDPAACLAELAALFAEPLTHLGKTKAVAMVSIEQPFEPSVPSRRRETDRVVLVLQSPARLLPGDLDAPATNGGDRLHQAYSRTWHELSGGALELDHAFTAQQLMGGGYWWHRFRRPDPAGAGDYRPQVFTTAGSVFALKIIDAGQAEKSLSAWAARGLPQLADAPGGECWRYNPWIAANGYGEVLLDPDLDACLKGINP